MKYVILILASVTMLFWVKANISTTPEVSGDLKEFDKISFRIAGEMNIFKGAFKIEKQATKEQLEKIEFVVKDRTLIVKYKSHMKLHTDKVKINISMPSLKGLDIPGSGKVVVEDSFRGSQLDLSISGSGKILMDAPDYTKLDCSIAGSGECIIRKKGKMDDASVNISGSGNFSAEDSDIEEMEVNISGSGNCTANVKQLLEVNIAGSGNVIYYGNPKIKKQIIGSGKVIQK
jgi:hypothetical protein